MMWLLNKMGAAVLDPCLSTMPSLAGAQLIEIWPISGRFDTIGYGHRAVLYVVRTKRQ